MGEDEGKTEGEQPAAGDELGKKRAAKKRGKKADAAADDVPEALRVPEGKGAKKPRKAKQTQLPGTERHDRIPEIEKAAAEYVEVRDERMGWTKKEVAKREIVRELMKSHGLKLYECDGEDLTVELLPAKEEKVKVKRRESDDDDDDLDDDEKGQG